MIDTIETSKLDIGNIKKDLLENVDNIRKIQSRLYSELNTVEKKVLDAQHYIELVDNLNASQGYNAYKILKDVLEERRIIKDRIEEIKPLNRMLNDCKVFENTMQAVSQDVDRIIRNNKDEGNTRRYKVRVMQNIFGEIIK